MTEEFDHGQNTVERQERAKAEAYWAAELGGEERIEVPQSKDCKVAIVIPACDEDPHRLSTLIESLSKQEGVRPENWELIIIVNNGEDDGSPEFQKIRATNEAFLRAKLPEGYRVFLIDKSSEGKNLIGEKRMGIVGKARNRGVAEASKRFDENQKNGILIQTDAEARFEDPRFIEKVLHAFEDPALIGAAGGIVYEFSPDDEAWPSWPGEKLRNEWEQLVLMKLVKRFSQFLGRQKYASPEWQALVTSGADFPGGDMLSRSYETAVVGGFQNRKAGEDTAFGKGLNEHASARNKKTANLKDSIVITIGLRESGRTPVAYKVFAGGAPGEDRFIADSLIEGEEAPLVPVRDAYVKVLSAIRKTEDGRAYAKRVLEEVPSQFRDPTGRQDFSFFAEM